MVKWKESARSKASNGPNTINLTRQGKVTMHVSVAELEKSIFVLTTYQAPPR